MHGGQGHVVQADICETAGGRELMMLAWSSAASVINAARVEIRPWLSSKDSMMKAPS
jgi:hypothetical protein